MEQSDLRVRLNGVFREVFNDDTIEIFDEMTANDIEQWDSLKHITLLVAIEQEFGVRFSAVEIGNLENVKQLMNVVKERCNE